MWLTNVGLGSILTPAVLAAFLTGARPSLQGDILSRPVVDFPGRSYDAVGIGEEIHYWIDRAEREGPEAVICWKAVGGTAIPITGPSILVTADLGPKDGRLLVSAWRADPGTAKPGPKATAPDLRRWARVQAAALPRRERPRAGSDVPAGPAVPDGLRKELYRMDSLREGTKTPFAEVEKLGAGLLRQYPGPAERGQVYYTLAHVHAQSGLVHPERVIEYARKALACPLDPLQAPRLYVYWGDAELIRRARNGEPREARRKWSAVPYLEGLNEALQYNLPDKAPETPTDHALKSMTSRKRIVGREEYKRNVESYIAATEGAYFQQTMIKQRDVLIGQLLHLYGRGPTDPELRTLAETVLRDPRTVDRVLAAMKAGMWGPR